MEGLGLMVQAVAPLALLVAPVLFAIDQHGGGLSIVVGFCVGIGLAATYGLLAQIAGALSAKKSV